MSSKVQKLSYVNFLKLIAIVGVISIHVSGPLINSFPPDSIQWQYSNVINSISRASVPLFVMISGLFLLQSNETNVYNMSYWRKRIKKVLIPTFFWTTIYYYWQLKVNSEVHFSINGLLRTVLGQTENYHLWYLYLALGLYLCAPVLKAFVTQNERRNSQYILFMWFTFQIIFPIISFATNINIGIDSTIFFNYLGYFILGYYIQKYIKYGDRKYLLYNLIILLIGIIITIFGSYYLAYNEVSPVDWFRNANRLNVFILAYAIFALMRNIAEHINMLVGRGMFGKIEKIVADTTFGVYLIHILVLFYVDLTFKWVGYSHLGHPILVPTLKIIVTYFLSVLFVSVIKKVPFIRSLTP